MPCWLVAAVALMVAGCARTELVLPHFDSTGDVSLGDDRTIRGDGTGAGDAGPGDRGTTSGDGWVGDGGEGGDAELPTECAGLSDFTRCNVVTVPDRDYDICVGGVCVSPGCPDGTCNPPGPSFQIADTNLRECWDEWIAIPCPGTAGAPSCAATALCGQDAQYGWDTEHTTDQRFTRTVSAEPVVLDQVTGLMWQGCLAGLSDTDCTGSVDNQSWDVAIDYCETQTWSGFTDWRLPDVHELLSIVDHGRASVTIDPDAFPGPTAELWSISSYLADPTTAWRVDFYDGALRTITNPVTLKSDGKGVRCVRGGPTSFPAQRFARSEPVTDQPVVVDGVTGRMWQGCARGQGGLDCAGTATLATWVEALAYCEALDWGNHTDWYLPNVKELRSLVDDSRGQPAIDPAFPATPWSLEFWSSTRCASCLDAEVWAIGFHWGGSSELDFTMNSSHVRCVRAP